MNPFGFRHPKRTARPGCQSDADPPHKALFGIARGVAFLIQKDRLFPYVHLFLSIPPFLSQLAITRCSPKAITAAWVWRLALLVQHTTAVVDAARSSAACLDDIPVKNAPFLAKVNDHFHSQSYVFEMDTAT